MLCMARVYAYMDEEMKWLWSKDLRTHTVHVLDVARGLWTAAEWFAHGKRNWTDSMGATPVFNMVDSGDTSTLRPSPIAGAELLEGKLIEARLPSVRSPGLNADTHRQDLRHQDRLPRHHREPVRQAEPELGRRRGERRAAAAVGPAPSRGQHLPAWPHQPVPRAGARARLGPEPRRQPVLRRHRFHVRRPCRHRGGAARDDRELRAAWLVAADEHQAEGERRRGVGEGPGATP